MAEKILNTRIQLKYDSYTNWTTSSIVLKAGEIAIATLAPFTNVENPEVDVAQHPVLFKVGDGTHTFAQLPWTSALAADVHTWAKMSEDEFKAWVKNLVPVEVIDNGTGKFVTDVTATTDANGLHITITRDDAVNTLSSKGDGIVVLTENTNAKGGVTVNGSHKKYNGAGTTTDTSSDLTEAGKEITIKVPSLTVDAYGHTTLGTETSHTIKLPGEIAVGDGDITIAAGKGLTDGGSFNVNQDTDSTITLNHQDAPTTGSAATSQAGSGRTYVTEVLVDDMGHIAGVKTATESDQDLSSYKVRQTTKTGTLSGAEVLGTWSQNENGEVAITSRTLTAADLGLDTVMHFVGAYTAAPTKAFAGTSNERNLADGDVYLNTANATEYVYSGGKWVELGNENAAGSHALKTITITGADGLEGGGDLSSNRTINIKDGGVSTAKIADKAVTEDKLADAVAEKLNKEWQPIGNYKTTQTVVPNQELSGATVVEGVAQSENGEITVTIRDLTPADIGAQPSGNYKIEQTAVAAQNLSGATVIKSVAQNANGEITVSTRDLTPADIGAATAEQGEKADVALLGAEGVIPAARFNMNGNTLQAKEIILSTAATSGWTLELTNEGAEHNLRIENGVITADAEDWMIYSANSETVLPETITFNPDAPLALSDLDTSGEYYIEHSATTNYAGYLHYFTNYNKAILTESESYVDTGISLTTDNVAPGTEIWVFNCGSATTVI